MSVMLGLIAIILSLLLVVGLHEAGHALAARVFKVKIKRIAIGFGKPLFSWTGKNGCEWVWARWPLGGYVRLLNARVEPVLPQDHDQCFDKKPVWVRIIILLSGAVANLITAWLAFILVFMLGYQQIVPVIASITPRSIAAQAGLQAGDRFIHINGQSTASWRDVGMRLVKAFGQDYVTVGVINREGDVGETRLNLSQWQYHRAENALLAGIGVAPDLSAQYQIQVEGTSFLQSIHQAFLTMASLVAFFLVMLKHLVMGVIPFSLLLGPIGVFSAMAETFIQGLVVYFYFIASLSLAVALINLFPVPGLDGGSILYAIIEKIRGKPLSIGMEVLLYRLAFIFFCVFLVQLLLNDLQRYLTVS